MTQQPKRSRPLIPESGAGIPASGNSAARAAAFDQGFLWYSDPTGETAVRNLMQMGRTQDLKVIDDRGDCIFLVKPHVLEEALHLWHFTKSQKGRNIRAHSNKNVPARDGHLGGDNEPTKH